MIRMRLVLAVSAIVSLGGCFSLSRDEPPQRHYVLGGGSVAEAAAPSGALANVSVGIRRLQIASYLESPFIVVRRGENQVGFSEFNRWGEPLSSGINKAVADYLRERGGFRVVDAAPWPTSDPYDYVLQLRVQQFEGVTSADVASTPGDARILVAWEVIRQSDELMTRGTTDYRVGGWPAGDFARLVSLLDAGVAVLTDDIIASITAAERTPATTASNATSSSLGSGRPLPNTDRPALAATDDLGGAARTE